MQTTHGGRVYRLAPTYYEIPALRTDMIARGWDGVVYHGVSAATGRQRKNYSGLFYRNAQTGAFVKVA